MSDENPLNLGATGRFPAGKLVPHDEGELRFAVAGDPERKLVFIEFGKPVASLALPPEKAEEFAASLMRKAAAARGEPEDPGAEQ